jgi:hypothetical protein
MGNKDATHPPSDDHADSDAYVTFDARTVILDLPDDGRVAELLPARGLRGEVAPAGAQAFARFRD